MARVVRLALALATVGLLTPRADSAWAQGAETIREGLEALAAGRLDAAAESFASASSPLDGVGAFNLGIVRAKQGRMADAAAAFVRAIERLPEAPSRARAHFNLGVVLAQLGQLPQALGAFAQTLRLDASDEAARTNFGITQARLAKTKPKTTPRDDTGPDAVRRALARIPDQSIAFVHGRRSSRRFSVTNDW